MRDPELYYITFKGGPFDGLTQGRAASPKPYYVLLDGSERSVYQPEVQSLKREQTYYYTGTEIPKPPRKRRDEVENEVVESLVGSTIVAAEWLDENPDEEWDGHEAAYLTLDDGRVIRFGAYGYDAWGATVEALPDPTDRKAV